MRKFKAFVSCILVLAMLISLLPLSSLEVKAADGNFTISSYRYNSTSNKYEITVKWTGSKTIKSAAINYTIDSTTDPEKTKLGSLAVTEGAMTNDYVATFDVSDMEANYIYGIRVKTFSVELKATDSAATINATTPLSTSNTIYFMTGLLFKSKRSDSETLPTGVYESGLNPELTLSWNIPKVLVVNPLGGGSTWTDITDAKAIEQLTGLTGSDLQFKIDIAEQSQDLGIGGIKSIFVKYSGGKWMANISGSTEQQEVTTAAGVMSLKILGGEKPTTSNGKLYHDELEPGTVYFMSINLNFYNSGKVLGDAYTHMSKFMVNPESIDINDKDITERNYTYTPIHFKLSRDISGNIYVTIYKVNQTLSKNLNNPYLTYSVQVYDGTDWKTKTELTDKLFSSSNYVVTVISDVTLKNTPTFRIVASSSKGDEIKSLELLYDYSNDTVKPPIPTNVSVDETNSVLKSSTVTDPIGGTQFTARSNDVTITWDEPDNYKNLDKTKLVYHIMLGTNPEDTNVLHTLNFPDAYPSELKNQPYLIHYRWVKAISAADSNIKEIVDDNGNKRLSYTLDGYSLFKYNSSTINLYNGDKYPDWLVENTIYYLKMFTTQNVPDADIMSMVDQTTDYVVDVDDFKQNEGANAETNVSEPSVATSFTTLPGNDKQIPVPTGFMITDNDVETGKAIADLPNYVGLQFDNLTFNINNYKPITYSGTGKMSYELYMASGSTEDPAYFKIATSDTTDTQFDIPEGYAAEEFSLQDDIWTAKIINLKQNTIYRFKVRVKLQFGDTVKYSDFSSVVAATTKKIEITAADEKLRVPMAPTDFSIAVKDGEEEITGTGAVFNWSVLEEGITYELITTSYRIDEEDNSYTQDSDYLEFEKNVADRDKNKNLRDDLNNLDPNLTGVKFTISSTNSKLRRYSVEDYMVPNHIYFYSLRAKRPGTVKDSSGNEVAGYLYSKWVTIPVTTSMIDEPLDLECVQDYQIGLQWEGLASGTARDYVIYIKKSTETAYKALDITKATIIKDETQYYGRINGLKSGTTYNIQVFLKDDLTTPVKTVTSTTRDEYHNVEVRWKGVGTSGYDYDIVIRDDSTGEYTTLIKDEDFKIVTTEKSQDVVGTQYYYYYAKITQWPVTLSDGSQKHNTLSTNTKYYIKVRTTKTGVLPSNFAGPVTARTSFLQSDYDNKDNLDDIKSKFVDRINQIDQKPYYQLNYVLTTTNTLLLKGDRLARELDSSPYHELKIDLTKVSSAGRVDEIYIPKILGDTLKNSGGSVEIVLDKAEYKLVANVLDESSYKEADDLKDDYSEQEIWFKLVISRPDGGAEGMDSTITPASQVNVVKMKALAMSSKYSDIKSQLTDKIYNSETGLVKKEKDKLDDLYLKDKSTFSSEGDYIIDNLVDEVEADLATYTKALIEGGYDSSTSTTMISKILGTREVNEFAAPMVASVFVNRSEDFYQPYGMYVDGQQWRKLDVLNKSEDNVSFELIKAGKYLIGVSKGFASSIPKTNWAYQNIVDFNNIYNIADVFTVSGDFNPDAPISLKEGILILDKVFIKDSVKGESLSRKVSKLGLSSYFATVSPLKDLSREQAATLYSAAYSYKNGLSISAIKPSSVVVFNDISDISQVHYSNAEFAVAADYMGNDANGNFNPSGYVTRAEFITALEKALQ